MGGGLYSVLDTFLRVGDNGPRVAGTRETLLWRDGHNRISGGGARETLARRTHDSGAARKRQALWRGDDTFLARRRLLLARWRRVIVRIT
jgi:hypothetical protein